MDLIIQNQISVLHKVSHMSTYIGTKQNGTSDGCHQFQFKYACFTYQTELSCPCSTRIHFPVSVFHTLLERRKAFIKQSYMAMKYSQKWVRTAEHNHIPYPISQNVCLGSEANE